MFIWIVSGLLVINQFQEKSIDLFAKFTAEI